MFGSSRFGGDRFSETTKIETTVALPTITLNPATANSNLTFSNSNLSVEGAFFFGANAAARATRGPTSQKTRFEATITSSTNWDDSNPITIMVDDGSNAFPQGQPNPGISGAPGCELRVGTTTWTVYCTGSPQHGNTASKTFAVGDVLAVEIDQTNGNVAFSVIQSGVETSVVTVTGLAISAWFAALGHYKQSKTTVNFTGPFSGTLSAGFSSYSAILATGRPPTSRAYLLG